MINAFKDLVELDLSNNQLKGRDFLPSQFWNDS